MANSLLFAEVPIETVADFWNNRPCNVRHSPRPVGGREYFDEVEARKYFVEPHIPRFADFPRWRNQRVLEIGCGIGTDTINFARHGALVTAVDLSPRSLQIARQRAEVFGLSDRIQFIQGNSETLSQHVPVEPYDLVYSFGVLHHTPHPGRALGQIGQYLHRHSTVKLMLYHRHAWKVLATSLGTGFRDVARQTARYSEAQTGCPVTYTYSRNELRRELQRHGLEPTEIAVDHVFPYRVEDYKQYRYVKEWYFRAMPKAVFRWFERTWGWHLLATAQRAGGAVNPA